MSKNVVLKTDLKEREAERKKTAEKRAYVGDISDNVLKAIEKVFGETEPSPTGIDMIDAIAFASVLLFARQIRGACKSKAVMKSVMKSMVWGLQNQIKTLAMPLTENEEAWDELYTDKGEEGGNNGGTESKEL